MQTGMKKLVTILPILLMASAGLAQTQWNNAAGGLWNEPFNWSPTNVPLTAGESAQFDMAGTYTATIAAVSPSIDFLHLTNPAVTLGINSGRFLVVDTMHNDGLVVINANGLSTSTFLRFDASTALTGTGTVTLNRFGSGARIETASGITFTNGSSHTINGHGEVRASLINEGLISAGSPGLTLVLNSLDKTNNAIVQATNGGELAIYALTLTQGPDGVVLADGGDVVFDIGDSSTIIGGSLNTINGGTITREASGTTTLEDVTNEGTLDINSAGVIAIAGAGLTNPGEVIVHNDTISSSAVLRFDSTGSLMGAGRVHLNRAGSGARLETASGMTVTNTATHTVDGFGDIRAVMVNDGLVSANVVDETLMLSSFDKTNNAVIEATDGGELSLLAITLTQSPAGVLLADGGDVVFDIGDSSTIIGGTLDTINGGTMTREASGTTTLVDITSDGTLGINSAGVIAIAGTGMNNDGTIIVNVNGASSSAVFRFDATGTIGGSGSLVLNRAGSGARVETAADTVMTNASTHMIEGFGDVRAELINEGLIVGNVPGETLGLSVNDKVNNAVIAATNGGELGLLTLTISQAPAGVIRADGGGVVFDIGDSQTIAGGLLETINGGSMTREASGTTTLEGVTNTGTIDIQSSGVLAIGAAGTTNDGSIVINSNNNSAAAVLRFPESATLGGNGTLRFNHAAASSRLDVLTDAVATIGPMQTIIGNARFNGDIVVEGTIAPGLSVGEIEAHGSLTLAPSATLEIEATDGTTSDTIIGGSDFTAGGTLRLTPIDGYTPAEGDSLTIVDAGSVIGEFDSLDLPPIGGGNSWRIRYDADSITLVVSCSADFNVDGQVNTLDVLAFLNAWTAGDSSADVNGDGAINTLDVLFFLNLWTTGC